GRGRGGDIDAAAHSLSGMAVTPAASARVGLVGDDLNILERDGRGVSGINTATEPVAAVASWAPGAAESDVARHCHVGSQEGVACYSNPAAQGESTSEARPPGTVDCRVARHQAAADRDASSLGCCPRVHAANATALGQGADTLGNVAAERLVAGDHAVEDG